MLFSGMQGAVFKVLVKLYCKIGRKIDFSVTSLYNNW